MDTSCLNFLQLCFPQNNWINFKLSCARLYSAFVTYVGDQCDAFFSFFGMKGMELKPWSMNFFVWFTLFDVMLPSCISWWNSSKFVQKKKTEYKCLIRLKSPVQIQVNRRQRFRHRRFFYYVMPPWYSRCEKENSRRIENYGKTIS